MGIRIEKKVIVYNSTDMLAIEPQYLGINETDLRKYLADNKFPEDPSYGYGDLVYDLLDSTGIWTLPNEIKQETCDYIVEALYALM